MHKSLPADQPSIDYADLFNKKFPQFSLISNYSRDEDLYDQLLVLDKDSAENATIWAVNVSELPKNRLKYYLKKFTLAMELDQPNMSKIKTFWLDDGILYLHTIESAKTRLDYVIEGGRLNYKRTLEIAAQVGEYLEYLHKEKIYSTSISPASVYVNQDFWISISPLYFDNLVNEIYPKKDQKGEFSSFLNGYQRNSAPCDRQTDIHSLGSLICYISTGYAPAEMPPEKWNHYGLSLEMVNIVSRATCREDYPMFTRVSEMVDLMEVVQTNEFGTELSKGCLKAKNHWRKETKLWSDKTMKLYALKAENSNYDMTEPSRSPKKGLLNNRYELGKCVEYNVLKRVFEAKDMKMDGKVVWIHLLDHSQCAKWGAQFKKTVRKLKKLKNDNICRIFDAEVLQNTAYIATQREQGESLDEFSSRHKYKACEVLDCAHQLCDALIKANEAGFDIYTLCPKNIRVYAKPDGGYFYRILGVGHSKLLGLDLDDSAYLDLLKSPEITSPELYLNKPVGHQTTQFMIGSILYRLVTGTHPCAKMDLDDAYEFHMSEKALILVNGYAKMSKPFVRWIGKLLRSKAANRFRTVDGMLTALTLAEDEHADADMWGSVR